MAPHLSKGNRIQTMNNVRDAPAMFGNFEGEGCTGAEFKEETGSSGDCRAYFSGNIINPCL